MAIKHTSPLFLTILLLFSWVNLPGQKGGDIPDLPIREQIGQLLAQSRLNDGQINVRTSFELASRALYLADSISYPRGQIWAMVTLSDYYSAENQYLPCIELLFSALKLAERRNYTHEIGIIYERLGSNFLEIKSYQKAKFYLEKSLNYTHLTGDWDRLGYAYCNLGRLSYELEQWKDALKFHYLVFLYFDSLTIPRVKLNAYRGLGTTYYYLKQDNWAIYYYQKAIQQGFDDSMYQEIGPIYTLLAHVYQTQGEIKKSLYYNRLAYDIRLKYSIPEQVASSLSNIGSLYLRSDQLDSAEFYLTQAVGLLKNTVNFHLQSYAYQQLLELYQKQENYPLAIKTFSQYKTAGENLWKTTNISETEVILANYKLEEIERQNEFLQKENEIQRLSLKNRTYSELITQMVIGITGVLILLTVFLFERNKLGKSRLETINRKLHQEIEERKQTESQLRTSEELYRFVTEHTLDLIVRMDRHFRYLFVSPSVFRMFGYLPEETPALPALSEVIPEKYHDELRWQYLEMIRLKKPVMLTHQSQRQNGSLFWSESLVNPIFDPRSGKLIETITVIRDITDRIAFEEALARSSRQKELLLREIHHRVKNNFAILVSLMNMQKLGSNPDDLVSSLDDLQGRVRTMALVHELLYRSQDLDSIEFGEYLNVLVSIVSRAYRNKSVEVRADLERCILDIETALPLGLISNEILTNAFKYAFRDHQEGRLWIDLHACVTQEQENGRFTHRLTFRDNGPGLPDGFSLKESSSMGSQIITLLVDQLEGRLDIDGTGGASFTIYFSDEKRS